MLSNTMFLQEKSEGNEGILIMVLNPEKVLGLFY